MLAAARERRERAERGRRVGRLRVVDVEDAVDRRDLLDPVRDARQTSGGPRRWRRRKPRRRAPRRSRPPRSRGCARPGSAARPAVDRRRANSTRRASPGTGPNPRGTTATSSASWRSKARSFAAAYASNDPWRSRWSGSRLVRTATAGAQRLDVLELEGGELAHDPRAVVDGADERRQRPADVPRDLDGHAAGLEDRAEQRGRRRLPVRPRDAEQRVRQEAGAELDLGDHRDAPRAGRGDG